MYKVVDAFSIKDLTVLVLDKRPTDLRNGVRIDNTNYELEMVYDITNAICIKGTGNFIGKTVDLF